MAEARAEGPTEGMVDSNEEWSDLQEQQTEIEALQGIYDQDMTVIKKDIEYKIMIRVDSPSAHVTLNIAKPTATTQQYSSLVDHLPPVTLFIRYPANYPSNVPPDFNLASRWLDSLYLDVVAVKLHEMFVPGCTVVYDWVCFIQENLVEIYSSSQLKSSPSCHPKSSPIENQLYPQDSAVAEKHPLQIFVRSSSIMTDVEEYNEFENHNAFLQNKHDCPLCLCEQLGSEFPEVKLDCGHLFCTECILSHIKVQLQHGGVGKIGCPEFECDKNISDHVIRCLLSGDDIIRYERLLDEYSLDVIPGMVFCPRPRCNARVASDPQDQLAVCTSCQYPFCKLCRQLWHGDNTVCPATVQLVDNTELETTQQTVKEKDSKAPISLEKQHDLMAIAWVRSNDVRNCPSCGWVIQKFGGCNKMTCLKCHKYFCWLCGSTIAGYSHFHKDGCVLFTNDDYLPPKEAEDVALPMVDLQELLEPACPRCDDKQEKKTDDNLITCKKCFFKFCYRCKEACYGRWHFSSEYGCPAYSKIAQDIAYFRTLTSPENTAEDNTLNNTEL